MEKRLCSNTTPALDQSTWIPGSSCDFSSGWSCRKAFTGEKRGTRYFPLVNPMMGTNCQDQSGLNYFLPVMCLGPVSKKSNSGHSEKCLVMAKAIKTHTHWLVSGTGGKAGVGFLGGWDQGRRNGLGNRSTVSLTQHLLATSLYNPGFS